MKSFSTVYKTSKQDTKINESAVYEAQRVKLIGKIKTEYSIDDFNALSESERKEYRKMVLSLWSPKTGLNKEGITFMNEGISPKSSKEQIRSKYMSLVRSEAAGIISAVVLGGEQSSKLAEITTKMYNDTKGGVDAPTQKEYGEWACEVLCSILCKKVKGAVKINKK